MDDWLKGFDQIHVLIDSVHVIIFIHCPPICITLSLLIKKTSFIKNISGRILGFAISGVDCIYV